jgi:hypothetical protein
MNTEKKRRDMVEICQALSWQKLVRIVSCCLSPQLTVTPVSDLLSAPCGDGTRSRHPAMALQTTTVVVPHGYHAVSSPALASGAAPAPRFPLATLPDGTDK